MSKLSKYILLSFMTFLLYACDGKDAISKKLIARYENIVNAELKNNIRSFENTYDARLEIPDFKCKADKQFIKCISNNIFFFKEGQEIFNIKNLEFHSNEIYKAENKGLISLKDYYNEFLKSDERLQTSVHIKGIRLSKELVKSIKEDLAYEFKDSKVYNFLAGLIEDEYELSLSHIFDISSLTEVDKELKYDFFQKLRNQTNTFHLDLGANANIKNSILNTLEKELDLKFDTQNLTYSKTFIDKLRNEFKLLLPKLSELSKEVTSLNNIKLSLRLDTQGVFESYVNTAKTYLETNENTDAKQDLQIKNILNILEDITKESVYKMNLNIKFKNILLKDYEKEGLQTIEKITINNENFTEFFKELALFLAINWFIQNEF